MKVKRMGITEILRRIWLFYANKIKSSEFVSKKPTQLILELNLSLEQKLGTYYLFISGFAKKKAFLTVTSFFFYTGQNSRLRTR